MISFLVLVVMNSAEAKIEIWTAKSRAEISEKQLSLDGGSITKLKCPNETKAEFAKLSIGKQTLNISCQSQYISGFFLGNQELFGEGVDAEDTWEGHGLFFLNKDGDLFFSRLSYSVNQDVTCVKNCPKPDCQKSEMVYKWDQSKNEFSLYGPTIEVPKRKFAAPSFYKKCK